MIKELNIIKSFRKEFEETGWGQLFYFSPGVSYFRVPRMALLNYSITGKNLYDFVLGKKEIPFLDCNQVKARMLMTVGWYRLIDIFGLSNLRLLLTDDALKWVWVDELREQYALARKTIERALL